MATMRSIWRRAAVRRLAIAALLVPACVFPADSPTGIEFSWLFREREGSDGDEGKRVLTCAAPGVETIAASIEDVDEPARHGTFRFACDDGFQTSDDLARRASEAFLELDPGDYDVVLVSERPEGHAETLATRTVDVLSRAVTLELWELTLEPVTWTVTIANADACTELSLGLYYADPQAALGDAPVDDEGEPLPVLYRENLASDRGLGVAGAVVGCAELGGDHVFSGVDRGVYRLEVDKDGTQCAIEIELAAPPPGGRDPSTTIDVAALPCG
jgi:hypothetical protein